VENILRAETNVALPPDELRHSQPTATTQLQLALDFGEPSRRTMAQQLRRDFISII